MLIPMSLPAMVAFVIVITALMSTLIAAPTVLSEKVLLIMSVAVLPIWSAFRVVLFRNVHPVRINLTAAFE
jgi:hypothetical protein